MVTMDDSKSNPFSIPPSDNPSFVLVYHPLCGDNYSFLKKKGHQDGSSWQEQVWFCQRFHP